MTVASQDTKIIYQGNGLATEFNVPFQVLGAENLRCRLVINGIENETSNFTVNEGTQFITVIYPASGEPMPFGEELIIYRHTPLNQEIDLEEGGAFHAKTHERAFDKACMQIQELGEKISRAATVGMADGEPPDINGIFNQVKIYAVQAEASAEQSENWAGEAKEQANQSRQYAEQAAIDADRAENAAGAIPGFIQNAHVFFGFTIDDDFNLLLTKTQKGSVLNAADYDVWWVLPNQTLFSLEKGSLIMEMPFQPPYE